MRISRERRAETRGALVLLAFLIWSLVPGAGAQAGARPAAPQSGLATIVYGKPAPDFAYDIGQGPRKLSEGRGTPVLIHFWDSWCGPCVDELPLFQRAHKGDPDMTIITVSDEDPGIARGYLKERGFDLPVTEDTEHKIFRLYSVRAIPATIFVRADGTVSYVSVGEMEWEEFSTALAELRRP